MTSLEIKQLLDEKYQEYCHSDFFIHTDPIQIPKLFEEKEDIEIAGFLQPPWLGGNVRPS